MGLAKAVKFENRVTIRFLVGGRMTYERIFNLKFKEDVPTYQLGKRYPRERKKISRIALLELPLSVLRELVKHEEEFRKLVSLKQWFFKKNGSQKKKV